MNLFGIGYHLRVFFLDDLIVMITLKQVNLKRKSRVKKLNTFVMTSVGSVSMFFLFLDFYLPMTRGENL